MSTTVKAAFWFTVCNVLQSAVQFIVTPIYTRILTTGQYGIYSTFMTWINILIIFGTLNISGGIYYNGIIKNERNVRTYTSSLQALSTICTLSVFIIVIVANYLFPQLFSMSKDYIGIMFLYILVYPAREFWFAENRINYRYKSIIIVTIISVTVAPLVSILLVIYGHMKEYGIILGFVSVNFFINITIYIYLFAKGHFSIEMQNWKSVLGFSIPLLPHYLSQVVLGQFDRIMINYFCGEAKTGLYTLAYQVGLVMSILTSGVNNVFTPWIYRQIKNMNYVSIKKVTNNLLDFFLLVNIIVILIAPEVIFILGSRKYQEAIWAIPPVMMSSFVMFAYCAFGTILFYFEKTKNVSFATTIGAFVNIVLNMLFIPSMGYIAAGYTTLFSYLVIFFLYYIFMKICCKKEKLEVMFDIKEIIKKISTLITFSGVSLFLYKNFYVRYAVFFFLVIILIVNRHALIDLFDLMKKSS